MTGPPRALWTLSALGFVLLWGVSWLNGTVDALWLVQETGIFPDSRPLRTVYTGYRLIDTNLLPLLAFFDVATNEKAHALRWLFFYVCGVIAAVNTWVLIESRRRGVRNFFLRHTIIFIFLWNSAGAAFVAPIYFYMITQSKNTRRDPTIPLNEARAFPPTLIANFLLPLIIFAPAWREWATYDRQGYNAFFNVSPLLMILVLVIFSRPGTTLTKFATPKSKRTPDEDYSWVVASFLATGFVAAAIHLYVIGASVFSPAATAHDLGLIRLLIPDPCLGDIRVAIGATIAKGVAIAGVAEAVASCCRVKLL